MDEYNSVPTPAEESAVEATVVTPEPAPKKQRNGVWMAIAVIALAVSILTASFAIAAAGGATQAFQIPQSVTPSYNYRTEVNEGDRLTPQEIIKKISPSVVTVQVAGPNSSGFGTGIIYTDTGYILTNAHVVDGATSIQVTLQDDRSFPATVIGSDAASDVAVIKISAPKLTPAEFGQSSVLVPGDMVIAVGTPYALELEYTATQGIVSSLRYDMNFSDLGFTMDLIQHDAAINPGNSGGPLVNEYGQVVGINSIKISGSFENLGFALQIDAVLPLAEELMNNGKITRPGIGITGYTYDENDLKGAFVYTVVPDGAADKAGLKAGDVIIKAGDKDITSIEDLKAVLADLRVGDSITVTYIRNNTVHTATIVLQDITQ